MVGCQAQLVRKFMYLYQEIYVPSNAASHEWRGLQPSLNINQENQRQKPATIPIIVAWEGLPRPQPRTAQRKPMEKSPRPLTLMR